ncbi:hypothetical protein A11A3_01642 [Alcanivorax hongdengensis A-11-3]|uniref:Uncharacterized protein n=1 Tax=Alcanivorax hongdengensis A-11-3 TaxID=1177179 RepID=L0WI74_9GAMM|nr:DUF4198 domain-containing protein [Alcanivorax hongdengensis]EKF75535.1 hypothetical protein A11A3_01642 [Alcanivorax hongdengensis A-11-3]
MMMPTLKKAGLLALLLAVALPAQAHKRWLLPSNTVLSQPQWITVDASVSNDIFFPERPFPLKGLTATGPDGKPAEVDNTLEGHRRSVFDVNLTQAGTYRLAIAGQFFFASYQLGGERKRARGRSVKEIRAAIPKGATQVKLSETVSRMETFVTVGAPNRTALKPTGQGLELDPITHPNDLYTGEQARWRLLVDGKPAAGVQVEVVPAGTRYRDQQNDWQLTSDANGVVTIDWHAAGRYFVEASTADDNASAFGATERRLQYLTTVEVLPL